MKSVRRRFFYSLLLMAAAALIGAVLTLPASAAYKPGQIVNHLDVDQIEAYLSSADVVSAIRTQKWFFAHASVGANMINGMNALHSGSSSKYPLAVTTMHNGTPPGTTTAGTIYEYNRGLNEKFSEKITVFEGYMQSPD